MVLVPGAPGRVGSEVVRALVARGTPVRAFVRDMERARGVLGEEAELRQGAGEQVTPWVEDLTGAPPRPFAAWARDHAHRFAPMAVGAGR